MKILLADDHHIFREGLEVLLKQLQPDFEIYQATGGNDVYPILHTRPIDVILLDMEMPTHSGFDILRKIREEMQSTVPVIMLTMHNTLSKMIEAHDLGANGYLTKDSSAKEVMQAIKDVFSGKEYYSESMRTPFLKALLKRNNDRDKITEKLSPREQEVLVMICNEFSTEQIAEKLFVSPLTINNHRRSLLAKTRAKNVAGLVLYAIRNNLFEID